MTASKQGMPAMGATQASTHIKTFGAAGMGVFSMAKLVHDDLTAQYGVKQVGTGEGVEEHFFAIGAHKKVLRPLVQKLLPLQQ